MKVRNSPYPFLRGQPLTCKCAATEIKNLRPIQEAITRFFKLNTWEEVIEVFGSTVSPEKLLQFVVSNQQ